MKFDIVRRQFAKIDDKWAELEDLKQRGVAPERTWSSFCIFVPAEQPDTLTTTLQSQVSARHIDIVPCHMAGGVWLLGAYYQLETLLPQLAL